ncbi:MAG: S-methyl-5-thioribose-1-phosphate isomerase [Fimbriimonas sp.]
MSVRALVWKRDHLLLLDQRVLPHQEVWLELRTHEQVATAIRDMTVRGAPAIGIAAAYGMALAVRNGVDLESAKALLAASRPTAVNLFWALDRISQVAWNFESVEAEAIEIEREDLEMNLAIGEHGAALIPPGANILTICNTGALATAGHGTALGVIRTAHSQQKGIHVWTCETRPRQQGLRLTAYELLKEGIPFHSIADGVVASLMRAGKVTCAIAGADRIAANGDSANKIGTCMVAVVARHFGVPFYIAAPSSTLDPKLAHGDLIPIEERSASELNEIEGVPVAPAGTPVFNPAFDVTPGSLIDAIITEKGVFRPPYSF